MSLWGLRTECYGLNLECPYRLMYSILGPLFWEMVETLGDGAHEEEVGQ
jgi:hypothetical protein